MQYSDFIPTLRNYSVKIGGPEDTLDMLEFMLDNMSDLPPFYRTLLDKTLDGYWGALINIDCD